VIVNRRLGGEFVVPATIAETRIAMLFDTGASTVVLRAEDAAKVGIDARALKFDVDVVTANGAASAAEVLLDRVAVGRSSCATSPRWSRARARSAKACSA